MDPKNLKFTKSHEWISPDGTVGISDHAQHEITDVVFVELPKVGRLAEAGEVAAVVESVKAAFDIYAPVAGTVAAINEEVIKNPGLVNQSPYEKGWLYRLQITKPADRDALMSLDEYQEYIKTAAH